MVAVVHKLNGRQRAMFVNRVCQDAQGRDIAFVPEPNPMLIIADEPTAGLDVSIQGEVLNLLNEDQESAGVAILLISHNMSVVRHSADRMLVLLKGEIVEAGPCAQVFSSPEHSYTRALIAASQHKLPERSEQEA